MSHDDGQKPDAASAFDRFVVGLLRDHANFAVAAHSIGLGERHFRGGLRHLFPIAIMGPAQVQDVFRRNTQPPFVLATLREFLNPNLVVPADSAVRLAQQIAARVDAARRVPITDIVSASTRACPRCPDSEAKIDFANGAFTCECSRGIDVIDFVAHMIDISHEKSVEFLISPHQQFIGGLISDDNARFVEAARAVGLDRQHFPGPLRLSFTLAMEGSKRVDAVIAESKYDDHTLGILKTFQSRWVKLCPDAMALAMRIVKGPPTNSAAVGGRDASHRSAAPAGEVRDNKTRARWFQQLFKDLAPKRITPKDYAVGVAIGNHVNKTTGESFPGFATLAKETGLSINTARAAIENLASAGHLRLKRTKPLVIVPVLHLVDEPHEDEDS